MYARACNHPYSEQTTRELVEFFDALERFRFIAFYVVPSKKSHFKRADGYSLAHDLYLREQNLSGAALFVQNWLKHINAPSVKFQDMVSEMFEGTDSKGFFSWDGLGYLLYRYETSLRGDAAKLVQLDDVSTETIEHILPQTIDGRAYWHDQFRGYDDRRHYFTHALGNLAVCSGRANSLYGNRPYYDENPKECKRELYKQGSFTLRKISHEHEEWGPEQIIQRTKELLEFMFKTWDIGILPSVNMNWLLYAKWFGLDRIGNNGGFE
jgi:hypothetical protein